MFWESLSKELTTRYCGTYNEQKSLDYLQYQRPCTEEFFFNIDLVLSNILACQAFYYFANMLTGYSGTVYDSNSTTRFGDPGRPDCPL